MTGQAKEVKPEGTEEGNIGRARSFSGCGNPGGLSEEVAFVFRFRQWVRPGIQHIREMVEFSRLGREKRREGPAVVGPQKMRGALSEERVPVRPFGAEGMGVECGT